MGFLMQYMLFCYNYTTDARYLCSTCSTFVLGVTLHMLPTLIHVLRGVGSVQMQ
jgi:hypothetical protein